jgi:hypothetical protein
MVTVSHGSTKLGNGGEDRDEQRRTHQNYRRIDARHPQEWDRDDASHIQKACPRGAKTVRNEHPCEEDARQRRLGDADPFIPEGGDRHRLHIGEPAEALKTAGDPGFYERVGIEKAINQRKIRPEVVADIERKPETGYRLGDRDNDEGSDSYAADCPE